MNYSLPKYDDYRNWIRKSRDKGKSWDEIKFAGGGDDSGLNTFLDQQRDLNFWDINIVDWKEIVQLEKLAEEQRLEIDITKQQAMICDAIEDSDVTVPTDSKSSWVLYKKHLLDNGFKDSTVEEIQKSSLKILKRLSIDKQMTSPVKGLVIGNVQSGKTGNMAALMAMAADWGCNMFIVLSGTIENLRKQTHNRLFKDLNHQGNLIWIGPEHLSKKSPVGQRAQDLHFEEPSNQRYLTVCLKNASRLRNLIQWLQLDSNKQGEMKILIIDDEADQASINTSDVNSKERKTINKLIVNLVNGKNEKGQDISTHYKAMNYIAYTATPYANVLNEASEESLYPKNFITTLSVSPEYFGPQQIFGLEGSEYEGLDIIRRISNDDLDTIKDIHDGVIREIPQQLENALCWFLCGAACMRIWDYKKPISMLIHTSQRQVHHDYIYQAIHQWLKNIANATNDLLEKCGRIWEEETSRFTFEDFKEQYPDYGREDSEINKYPDFESIASEIIDIVAHITNIPLGEDGELSYHTGLHICVDNCSNNRVTDEGMYVRLAYPEPKDLPDKAPVFLVIGGSTIARGLTIEGLISTFFLRTVRQADTLMQMGRWFGYRKGYELLPRIWLTDKATEQFKYLASLDEELRAEICELDSSNAEPREYGPKVKENPKYTNITAKNKMQSATKVQLDFSGSFMQTTIFDNNYDVLKDNIAIVEEFILSLGKPVEISNPHAKNALIWKDISFELIDQMLQNYHFCSRGKAFNDIENVSNWIREMSKSGDLGNWNVVVSGTEQSDKNKIWDLEYGNERIGKVTRTQKIENTSSNFINIGVLRDPEDLVVDIDLNGKSEELKQKVKDFNGKGTEELRAKGGLESTPQLIIYMIDKDSKVKKTGKRRKDLAALEDIVGLCLNIPGRKQGVNYSKYIAIKLENINDELDLEDVN